MELPRPCNVHPSSSVTHRAHVRNIKQHSQRSPQEHAYIRCCGTHLGEKQGQDMYSLLFVCSSHTEILDTSIDRHLHVESGGCCCSFSTRYNKRQARNNALRSTFTSRQERCNNDLTVRTVPHLFIAAMIDSPTFKKFHAHHDKKYKF